MPQRLWKRASQRELASIRLDGIKYCFPQCFDLFLQRKFNQLLHSRFAKPRRPHRIPLGLLMLARGEIDSAQLRKVLAAQRSVGSRRIGHWIEHLGYACEAQITAAVGAQWACPVLPRLPEYRVVLPLPLTLLRRYRMFPVHYVESLRLLHMAFSDGVDYAALLAIEQALECQAQPCIISSTTLDSLLAQMEEKPRRPDQFFEDAHSPGEMARITSSYSSALAAENVRLVRCGEFIWVRVQGKDDSANLLFPVEEQREEFLSIEHQADLRSRRTHEGAKAAETETEAYSASGYAGSSIPFSR